MSREPKITRAGARAPRPAEAGPVAASGAVDRFLDAVKGTPPVALGAPRGRLLFALDATLSRQPTWDRACALQVDMFDAAASVGGLAVKLLYFRGHGEFRATAWASDARVLARHMTGVQCRGGNTQIARVLRYASAEAARGPVGALVYVGDCMEESADALVGLAGELALRGTPVFVFHEIGDPGAAATFQALARVSKGAYCRLDAGAGDRLRKLLNAVAIYAAGGRAALEALSRRNDIGARLLLEGFR